jgi:asparagine synthase (glutamine-hydrolysing)
MSGILGFLAPPSRIPYPEAIRRALESIRHRGPDDSGFASFDPSKKLLKMSKGSELLADSGPAALGATRLSILDLSYAAHQPFVAADGRYVLVYDGEIYNYRELREELGFLGHNFRSSGDTEVLLHAYETWGEKCLLRFEGMFAFAILDILRQRLFLARDPFGIKPLYYTEEGGFFFASQLGGLLSLSGVSRKVNSSPLERYLATGWSDKTDGETLLSGIHRFPAGCFGTISLNGDQRAVIERYWSVPNDSGNKMRFSEAAGRLRELFLDSVGRHLDADAPVAAALSGGLDSSSIVAAMRQVKGDNAEIHTFSFLSPGYSEIHEEPWARIVASKCRTIMHQVFYAPQRLSEDFDRFVLLQDWPASSPVIYAQQQVFEAARAGGFRVMLSGQGSDTYLAGSPYYIALRSAAAMQRGMPLTAARLLIEAKSRAPRSRLSLTRQAIGALAKETRRRLNNHALGSFRDAGERNLFRAALHDSFEGSLLGTLRIEDANSMACSVENRLPFLTPRLVAFGFSLPDSYLVSAAGETKSVFRAAMRGITPDEILDRHDKMGFPVPVDAWLRALQPRCEDWIDDAASLPCLDPDVVRNTWKRFIVKRDRRQGSADAFLLWRWIFLAGWVRRFDVRFE